MKRKLSEMRYGDRFFLFPVSPVRAFVSLEFSDIDGMWWLSYTENGGPVMKKPVSKDEMDKLWNVIKSNDNKKQLEE